MADRLRLYYPVTPYFLNQQFGDNIPCVKDFGLPTQMIVDGADYLTCPPGYTKLYQQFGMSGHNGDDLRAGEQNCYAAQDGVVIEKQIVPARGLGIGILTNGQVDLGAHGVHFAKLRYWHLKVMYVEVGDVIKAGQLIGVTDSTGYSSGNHLHFELQPMDKDAGGHPFITYYPVGEPGVIAGAIDPTPFFIGSYATDIPKLISLYSALIPLLTQLINYLKK